MKSVRYETVRTALSLWLTGLYNGLMAFWRICSKAPVICLHTGLIGLSHSVPCPRGRTALGGRWMVFLVELRGGVASWVQVHLRDHLGDLLRVAQWWSTVSLGIVWLFTAATSLWRFLDFFAVWHNLFAILFTGSGWSLEGKIFCSNLLCACAYACVRNWERELESCLANALIRH